MASPKPPAFIEHMVQYCGTVASVMPEKLLLDSSGGLSYALPLLYSQFKAYRSQSVMP